MLSMAAAASPGLSAAVALTGFSTTLDAVEGLADLLCPLPLPPPPALALPPGDDEWLSDQATAPPATRTTTTTALIGAWAGPLVRGRPPRLPRPRAPPGRAGGPAGWPQDVASVPPWPP